MEKTLKDYINGEIFTLYTMGEFGGLIGKSENNKIIKGEKGEYRLQRHPKHRGFYLSEDFLDKNYWSSYEFIAFLNINDARKEAIERTKSGIKHLKRIGQKQEIIEEEEKILKILETGSDNDIIFGNKSID